jgi:ABC-2 type transport system ATP-binding protein
MIEAIGLTKYYGKTLAVDDLSFTVRPGAVTGFLGPNGSGKSTTMRLILGLDNPSRGSTKVAGHQYAHLTKPLTQVGALLDANWIHPNRSARSHLRFMAASNKIPVSRVDEVLDIVGLSSVAKRAAGKFSLGMKQRLGLAGALLGDPQVLLFDEPVNGLDPEGIFWVRTFMKNLAAQGKTVFVSSHLLSEMALTADHLIVIGRGRLIAESSTEEFIARSTQTSVRVRSPRLPELRSVLGQAGLAFTDEDKALIVTGAPTEQIGDLAGAAGITLHELSPQSGSLEEAFIQLTGDSVEYGTSRAVSGQGGFAVQPPPQPAGFRPPGAMPQPPPGALPPPQEPPPPLPPAPLPPAPEGR